MPTTTDSRDRARTPPAHGDLRAVHSDSRPRDPSHCSFGHWWWALPGDPPGPGRPLRRHSDRRRFRVHRLDGIGTSSWIGFDNFVRIFQDPTKLLAPWNTLFLAFGSVVLVNVIGLLLALGLNRGLKSRYVLRVLFFMPVVLSPLAVSYVWKFIFDFDGPINEILRAMGLDDAAKAWIGDPSTAIWTVLIVIVWQHTGFAMVIYMAGLAAVPVEIEEAAAIDGANLWQRFWHVTLPAIRPAVAIATTLGLVNGLRIFDQIMALTAGGPAGATETLATQVYKQSFTLGNFGYGAALALVLTAIILVFAIIQQRVTNGRRRTPDMFRYSKLTALREVRSGFSRSSSCVPFYFLVTTALKIRYGSAHQLDPRAAAEPRPEQLRGGAHRPRADQHPAGADQQRPHHRGIIVGLVLLGALTGYVIARSTRAGAKRCTTCS